MEKEASLMLEIIPVLCVEALTMWQEEAESESVSEGSQGENP